MTYKMPALLAWIASSWIIAVAGLQGSAHAEEEIRPIDIVAMDIARSVTAQGAEMLEAGDIEGVVDQYIGTGELITTTTRPDRRPTTKIIRGKDNLRKYFKVAENLRELAPTNLIDYARIVAPNTIYMTGILKLTGNDEKVTRIPFSQVRVLIGTTWKIVSLQVIFQEK